MAALLAPHHGTQSTLVSRGTLIGNHWVRDNNVSLLLGFGLRVLLHIRWALWERGMTVFLLFCISNLASTTWWPGRPPARRRRGPGLRRTWGPKWRRNRVHQCTWNDVTDLLFQHHYWRYVFLHSVLKKKAIKYDSRRRIFTAHHKTAFFSAFCVELQKKTFDCCVLRVNLTR